MKTTELIGKKVLDDNANEIGKIQDIDLDLKENNIIKIIINTNEFSIRKTNLEITSNMVSEVGDYLLLNIVKSEISKDLTEIPEVEVINPNELEEENKSN